MGKMYYLERRKTLGVESRFGAGRRLGIIFSTRQAEKTGYAPGAYCHRESDLIDPSGVLGSMWGETRVLRVESASWSAR